MVLFDPYPHCKVDDRGIVTMEETQEDTEAPKDKGLSGAIMP